MELNREQIVKALECCVDGNSCEECPYDSAVLTVCTTNMARDALALIRELTEEKERIAHESACHRQTVIDNLQRSLEYLYEETERVKADTVRKMQERLKAQFCDMCEYGGYDVRRTIDQIAQEMLEEEKV